MTDITTMQELATKTYIVELKDSTTESYRLTLDPVSGGYLIEIKHVAHIQVLEHRDSTCLIEGEILKVQFDTARFYDNKLSLIIEIALCNIHGIYTVTD